MLGGGGLGRRLVEGLFYSPGVRQQRLAVLEPHIGVALPPVVSVYEGLLEIATRRGHADLGETHKFGSERTPTPPGVRRSFGPGQGRLVVAGPQPALGR